MSDLTRDGARYVAAYLRAATYLRRRREDVERAERDMVEAETVLGEWILPPDARIGETIAVWEGDSLFAATKTVVGVRVEIRSRGKHFHDLEVAGASAAPFCGKCGSRTHGPEGHA